MTILSCSVYEVIVFNDSKSLYSVKYPYCYYARMAKTAQQLDATREAGRTISATPGHVRKVGMAKWPVHSQTTLLLYTIILGVKGFVCDCPQAKFGKGLCKHAAAVEVWLAGQWAALHERTVTIIKRPPVECHYGCKNAHIVKDGPRKTKRKGKVQKYLCRTCNRRFSGLRKLKGYHASIQIMADGLSLASKRMPLSDVASELRRKGYHFHPSTIYRWVAKCGPLMDAHTKKLSPWASFKWHCDEIYYKVLGKEAYLFMVMDYSTRFVVANMSSPKKLGAKPLRMFKRAVRWTGVTPWVFVTDGLSSFVGPAQKAFWRSAECLFVHVAEIHSHNVYNVQESLNGDIKPLLRRRGGFKILNSPLIALGILGYNFFRPHGALDGKTPAEAAGIYLEGMTAS